MVISQASFNGNCKCEQCGPHCVTYWNNWNGIVLKSWTQIDVKLYHNSDKSGGPPLSSPPYLMTADQPTLSPHYFLQHQVKFYTKLANIPALLCRSR